jgi:hypothetical protein
VRIYRPDRAWKKGDYIKRNIAIVDDSDKVYAFWDGTSPGTIFSVAYAIKKGKFGGMMVAGKKFVKNGDVK